MQFSRVTLSGSSKITKFLRDEMYMHLHKKRKSLRDLFCKTKSLLTKLAFEPNLATKNLGEIQKLREKLI